MKEGCLNKYISTFQDLATRAGIDLSAPNTMNTLLHMASKVHLPLIASNKTIPRTSHNGFKAHSRTIVAGLKFNHLRTTLHSSRCVAALTHSLGTTTTTTAEGNQASNEFPFVILMPWMSMLFIRPPLKLIK